MVEFSSDYPKELERLSGLQQDRAMQADEVYKKLCEEMGMRVCAWQSFNAWQEFVDEKIGASQLAERARDELDQFSRTFGKYLIIEKEDPKRAEEETERKERAKQANRIYKSVCDDTGLTTCFFSNFSTWTEYVKGRIDESEFYEKAREEVKRMLIEDQQPAN